MLRVSSQSLTPQQWSQTQGDRGSKSTFRQNCKAIRKQGLTQSSRAQVALLTDCTVDSLQSQHIMVYDFSRLAGMASLAGLLWAGYFSCKCSRSQVRLSLLLCQCLLMLILSVDLPCSKDAEQDFAILIEQSSLADAHASFDANSGGETWDNNTRRIATDVVSNR